MARTHRTTWAEEDQIAKANGVKVRPSGDGYSMEVNFMLPEDHRAAISATPYDINSRCDVPESIATGNDHVVLRGLEAENQSKIEAVKDAALKQSLLWKWNDDND